MTVTYLIVSGAGVKVLPEETLAGLKTQLESSRMLMLRLPDREEVTSGISPVARLEHYPLSDVRVESVSVNHMTTLRGITQHLM